MRREICIKIVYDDVAERSHDMGEDVIKQIADTLDCRFQSTLPVWGATIWDIAEVREYGFQSTLPVWGATDTIHR